MINQRRGRMCFRPCCRRSGWPHRIEGRWKCRNPSGRIGNPGRKIPFYLWKQWWLDEIRWHRCPKRRWRTSASRNWSAWKYDRRSGGCGDMINPPYSCRWGERHRRWEDDRCNRVEADQSAAWTAAESSPSGRWWRSRDWVRSAIAKQHRRFCDTAAAGNGSCTETPRDNVCSSQRSPRLRKEASARTTSSPKRSKSSWPQRRPQIDESNLHRSGDTISTAGTQRRPRGAHHQQPPSSLVERQVCRPPQDLLQTFFNPFFSFLSFFSFSPHPLGSGAKCGPGEMRVRRESVT